MKERPILMSGAMVRAILAGRKTQTRRIIKRQPITGAVKPTMDEGIWSAQTERSVVSYFTCPHGQPGDRLWVRETWQQDERGGVREDGRDQVYYRADMPNPKTWEGTWKPSIFMPRWASRITLEIVSVRAERLQDITEEDAIAEGVAIDAGHCFKTPDGIHAHKTAVGCFNTIWNSINGPGAFELNPWIWRIEFPSRDGTEGNG